MRFRDPLVAVAPLVISLVLLSGGCSKEPTPEEKQADSTLVIAKTQLDRGKYREGRRFLHTALALDLKLNRTRQLADEYTLLARVSILSGAFDSAIVYFNNAIEQYRSLTDRRNARALLLDLASLHRQMGEERVAYEMYMEALRLASVFNDVEGAREIELAMLPACRALENTEDQMRAINDLLKAYIDTGNLKMQARPHYESALWSINRREYQQAEEPLLRALTLAEQARDSLFVVTVLGTLADAYQHVGNLAQAFQTYTDALTRSDRTSGARDIRLSMLIRVGNIYLGNGQFSDAIRFYRAALTSAITLKNKLAEGYMFIQLGHCAAGAHQNGEALKNIQTATELFTSVGYNRGIAYANLSMGLVRQHAGQLSDAVASLKSAVENMEQCSVQSTDVYAECERVVLHEGSYYDPLIDLLFQLGRNDEAFSYAEGKSEHRLFEEFAALEIKTRNKEVDTLLSRLHHARALHIGCERQLAITLAHGPYAKELVEDILGAMQKANNAFQEASAALIRIYPRLEPAARFGTATIEDVQHRLPQGTALLRSVVTGRSLYTYAITNAKATVQVSAIEREHLHALMDAYGDTVRQLVALADSPAVQRKSLEQHLQGLSSQLYAVLIRPVESTLAGATKLLVQPDDETVGMPIHALRKGGPRTLYCIEQFAISYLPTITMLKSTPEPPVPSHEIVALGHPGTTSWDVEYELRDIRAFYKDARLYFGRQASIPTLRRERGDVLHLALDLQFSERSPGNAHTLLSDGITPGTIREIPWGDFLSTAAFHTVIVSNLRADSTRLDCFLPAIFLANGSSSVILNMYPTSRKAKKFFGEIFYTTLLAGKSSEDAYRQVMLEMIKNKDYAAPSNWAPFLMWGEN